MCSYLTKKEPLTICSHCSWTLWKVLHCPSDNNSVQWSSFKIVFNRYFRGILQTRITKTRVEACRGWFWTKLFLLNFSETKQGTPLFESDVGLFEQASTCRKQTADCFKIADISSEKIISGFVDILACKINLNNMDCLKLVSDCSERCVRLFIAGACLLWNRHLSALKQTPACFEQRFACFIHASVYLNQAGTCFKTGLLLIV